MRDIWIWMHSFFCKCGEELKMRIIISRCLILFSSFLYLLQNQTCFFLYSQTYKLCAFIVLIVITDCYRTIVQSNQNVLGSLIFANDVLPITCTHCSLRKIFCYQAAQIRRLLKTHRHRMNLDFFKGCDVRFIKLSINCHTWIKKNRDG